MNDTILFDSTVDTNEMVAIIPFRDNFYYFERIPEQSSSLVDGLTVVNFLLIVLVLWQVFRKKPTRG